MNGLIPSFNDPMVRQLAWACLAPPLIADFRNLADKVTAPAFELHEDRHQRLRALDADPTPLHHYMAEHCRSRRLGLVFEALWHFFIKNDPETEMIAHNLPVREGKKTLGEFDILYFCRRRNRAIHLELAVKYFLATPKPAVQGEDFSYWLGPNSRDRLDIKWQRMLSHQLALPATAAAKKELAERSINEVDQEVAIKGWLFHHRHGTPVHPSLSPQHPRGVWWPRTEFLREHSLARWRYLSKPHWLADESGAKDVDDTALALSEQRPIMLISTEGERLMLTPDNWPAAIEPRQ